MRLAGRYQLVRELQAGGMGRVYQAVDVESGRSVAAKVMNASEGDPLTALLRFQQEGAVLATLKHPNIVEVLGTFSEGETACIIMELLEGQSLAQILEFGPLSLARTRHLGRQAAAALAYAHGRGIVHRDIKPSNIMVDGNDHVKVADFGIARIMRAGATLNTATGMSLGTPLYMAPEQVEGLKVDGRADIYSLGAVLYQMVTGHPPFEGDDPLSIAFQHVHKPPRAPRDLDPSIPEAWQKVILTALAKQPADRYQGAEELEKALSRLPDEALDPAETGLLETRGSTSTAGSDATVGERPSPSPSTETDAPRPPVREPQPPPAPDATAPGVTRLMKTPPPDALVPKPSRPPVQVPQRERMSRPPVAPSSQTSLPPASPPEVARTTEPAAQPPKSGRSMLPILGGLAALIIVIAAVAFFVTRPHNSAASPTATPRVSATSTPRPTSTTQTTLSAKKIITFGSFGSGKGQFNDPEGVAVDTSGNVFVADRNNNRVEEFNLSGKLIGSGGKAGSGPKEFNHPTGLATDASGNVYVADSTNSRIQEFSGKGKFLHSWGSPGSGPGQFDGVHSVAVDADGNVYAADRNNFRVQKLSAGAAQFAPWGPGRTGSTQSQLQFPVGVAVDSQGNVYVCELAYSRVRKLAPSGQFITQFTHWGASGTERAGPHGVDVDQNGNIYVADYTGNTVQVLSQSGKFLAEFDGAGPGKGKFNHPADVAVDDQGNIFVADSGNNRIVEIQTK